MKGTKVKLKTLPLVSTLLVLLLCSSGAFATGNVITVANRSFLNQTAVLPQTTIFTPASAGMFRACIYITTQQVPSADPVAQFEWTDEFRAVFFSVSGFAATTGTNGTAALQCFPIHSAPSAPITVSGGATGVTFDMFVTIEKLP
jgi:hypothetical protein